MSKVVMLTKNNCHKCEALKMFLKFAMNNKYEQDIELVNQQEHADVFNQYADKFQVVALPALIFKDEILRDPQPSATMNFFEKHIGKK